MGGALLHIHDVGLLHLDVKPSNIIVAKGRPVLVDFGIARWQTAPRPKGVRGSYPYMAPEECLLQTVTPAADVFGLGVTLYELVTGNLPFPDSQDEETFPQVLQAPSTDARPSSGGANGSGKARVKLPQPRSSRPTKPSYAPCRAA